MSVAHVLRYTQTYFGDVQRSLLRLTAVVLARMADMEIDHALRHAINCLSDDGRAVRRRGLLALQKLSDESFSEAFDQHVGPALFKTVGDAIEKHREMSVTMLTEYYDRTAAPSLEVANELISVLHERVGGEQFEEQSEELRLLLIELLSLLLKKLGTEHASELRLNYVLDCAVQLCADGFPDVKKLAANVLTALCTHAPAQARMSALRLLRALILNCRHQRAAVRLQALEVSLSAAPRLPSLSGQAIASIVPLCEESLDKLMKEHVLPLFHVMQTDRSPHVRRALGEHLLVWLQCPNTRMQPYHANLLNVVLCIMNDELPDVATRITALVDETASSLLAGSEAPADGRSPTTTWVASHAEALVQQLLAESAEWTADVRRSSLAKLQSLLQVCAVDLVPWQDQVVAMIVRGIADPDPDVAKVATACVAPLAAEAPTAVVADTIVASCPALAPRSQLVQTLRLIEEYLPLLTPEGLVESFHIFMPWFSQQTLFEQLDKESRVVFASCVQQCVSGLPDATISSDHTATLVVAVWHAAAAMFEGIGEDDEEAIDIMIDCVRDAPRKVQPPQPTWTALAATVAVEVLDPILKADTLTKDSYERRLVDAACRSCAPVRVVVNIVMSLPVAGSLVVGGHFTPHTAAHISSILDNQQS